MEDLPDLAKHKAKKKKTKTKTKKAKNPQKTTRKDSFKSEYQTNSKNFLL